MKETILILTCAFIFFRCSEQTFPECNENFGQINYPVIAHSHNDYEQEFPISNAIDHGFSSIEVDIAYDGTYLRVSHDDKNLTEKPLFEESYLLPILNNQVSGNSLILLVDIKNYSSNLIEELNTILLKHESKLIAREQSSTDLDKLKILLSGEIPRQELIKNPINKFLFIDGRFNDEDINSPSEIMPVISMNISDISDSNANNEEGITEVINQVHNNGKMIRFWNTNDKEVVWLTLINLNVDFIGVDNIEKFCGVMKKNDLIN